MKSGYGALDEAALAQLERELEAKEAAEVAKVLAREVREMERTAEKLLQENEKAAKALENAEKAVEREARKVAKKAVKAVKVAEREAEKVARDAVKTVKAAEKVAKKIAKDAELAARKAAMPIGRGRGGARARGRGRGCRPGQGTGACPFPMSLPGARASSVNSINSGILTHSSIMLSDQTGIDSDSDDDVPLSDDSSIRSAITPPPDYHTVAPPANAVPPAIPECTLSHSRPVRTCRPTLRALGK